MSLPCSEAGAECGALAITVVERRDTIRLEGVIGPTVHKSSSAIVADIHQVGHGNSVWNSGRHWSSCSVVSSPGPDELHLVHHPEAVVVEQPEVHRPAVAAHAVAAVERPGSSMSCVPMMMASLSG